MNLQRGMIMTDGDLIALVTRPITAAILALALVSLALPYLLRLYARRKGDRELARLAELEV